MSAITWRRLGSRSLTKSWSVAMCMAMVAVLVPTTSAAQPGWTLPESLWTSDSVYGAIPHVGVDASGNVVAVWKEEDAENRAAHYSVIHGSWTRAVSLSAPGDLVGTPFFAMNAGGHAIAAWTKFGPGGIPDAVEFVTFSAQLQQWSAIAPVANSGTYLFEVGIDDDGNAVAVLGSSTFDIATTHYNHASGTWSAPLTLGTGDPLDPFRGVRLAVAGNGDAVVLMHEMRQVRAWSYRASTNAWSSAPALATAGAGSYYSFGSVAADSAGRFLAAWTDVTPTPPTETSIVQSVLLDAGASAWTRPTPVMPGDGLFDLAIGNGQGLLLAFDRSANILRSTTFDLASGSWGPVADLAPGGASRPTWNSMIVDVAMNPSGDGVAVWESFVSPGVIHFQAAFFAHETGTWGTITDLSTQWSYGQRAAIAPNGHAVAGFVASVPEGGRSTQVARYVPGSPSPVLASAIVNRPNVTLSWAAPTLGPPPTGYTVMASPSPGGAAIASLPVGTQTSLTVPAPDGTYYVRVLAAIGGATVASNEVRVDVTPPVTPGLPQNFTALVSGSVITFTWEPPVSDGGAPINGFVMSAGSRPGRTDIARLSPGPGPSFVTPPVPDGSYYVRLQARNAAGLGQPTPDIRVVVGQPPPNAPTLTGTGYPGGAVTLNWTVPSAGVAATGYEIHAGTGPGSSDVILPLSPSQITFSTVGVASGTYFVRVVATSAQGLGDFSNEITIIVP